MSTQIHRPRGKTVAERLLAIAALSIVLVSLSAVPAWSATSAQQQGAALLAQVQNGQTSCSKLSSSNFALMGEYEMGRIIGSAATYNAMNAQMQTTAGTGGEQRATDSWASVSVAAPPAMAPSRSER
ncbi:MAG: hypothetical protein M3Y17_05595 [Actinomycetota bacterium]|nr:hypothetical protein [Actinomycetota bacterium]